MLKSRARGVNVPYTRVSHTRTRGVMATGRRDGVELRVKQTPQSDASQGNVQRPVPATSSSSSRAAEQS
jgi:hypothetical protein